MNSPTSRVPDIRGLNVTEVVPVRYAYRNDLYKLRSINTIHVSALAALSPGFPQLFFACSM